MLILAWFIIGACLGGLAMCGTTLWLNKKETGWLFGRPFNVFRRSK